MWSIEKSQLLQQGKHILKGLDINAKELDFITFIDNRGETEPKLKYLLNNIPGASETPLQMFKRLYQDHSDILAGKIVPVKREKLYSLSYISPVKSYYDILSNSKEGIKQVIVNIKSCTEKCTSFIVGRYQVHILEKYNKNLKSKDLGDFISKTKSDLDQDGITRDIEELNRVFTVKLPAPGWDDKISTLTNTMPYDPDSKGKKSALKNTKKISEYFSSLKPYFGMYYTILELGLEKEYPDQYGKWVKKFLGSKNFKFYTENLDLLIELERWSQTLTGSLDVNKKVEKERLSKLSFSDAQFWRLIIDNKE